MAGPDFHRPPAPQARGYLMPDEAAPDAAIRLGRPQTGPWWRAFNAKPLDAVVELALAGNPNLAAAEASLEGAREAVVVARSGLYPRLDAVAGVQRQRINLAAFGFSSFPGVSNNPTFNLYSLGATASYAIPAAGGVKRGVEAAQARADSEARRADAAALTLSGEVAMQAAVIAGLRGAISEEDAVLGADQRLLELAKAAIADGGEAVQRRIGAQSQLAADEARLPPLRQSLAAARHALAVLVGKAPADWRAPDFSLDDFQAPAEIPLALPSELVRRRPDIAAAEADLHAATADVGVAAARLYPSLTLTGALTQAAFSPERLFNFPSTAYDLGLGLAQPVLDGGRLRAERRQAQAARRAALEIYEATIVRAFGQVADLLDALGHDKARVSALDQARRAAAADLTLAQAAHRAGAAGLLPVLEAERQLAAARRDLVEAKTRSLLDLIDLCVAAGADVTSKGT